MRTKIEGLNELQVQKSRAQFGENTLDKKKKK
jgi:hypothetical protein